MNLSKIILVSLFSHFITLNGLNAQTNPNSKELETNIDSLFVDKTGSKVPGASVVVIENESIVFSKNYGTANLAFNAPFDANTVFQLDGFTEQLVTFSLLQLESKKQINLNDPVNKYLPNLDFQDDVTLSHLYNHNSGLQVIASLRLMAGWNFSDPFYQEDFLSLTKGCAPNLNPDQEFNHSHSGIKLLMMVIEKSTGMSFSEYVSENIFTPLNMTNSAVGSETETTRSAVGYSETDHGYVRATVTEEAFFCPPTKTTQTDFSKWMLNFQSKKFEGGIVSEMEEALSINGNQTERKNRDYCVGQFQYYKYLGKDYFYSRETGNGYSWMWIHFPESNVSIMAVGNLDSYIGSKAFSIADLLIEYDAPNQSNALENLSPAKLSQQEMEACVGSYWNEDFQYTTEISIVDGELFHSDEDNGFNFAMIPKTNTFFYTPFGGTLEFSKLDGNQTEMKNILPNGLVFVNKQFVAPKLKEKDLLNYTGEYSSEQFNMIYSIVLEGKKMILKRSRKPDIELTAIGHNKFRTPEVDFRLIEFEEDKKGAIINLKISNNGVKRVEFGKL